jgi:hypothetical protein
MNPLPKSQILRFTEKAIGDLPVGKAVIVPRERRLCDDIHPELPLIGAVGV